MEKSILVLRDRFMFLFKVRRKIKLVSEKLYNFIFSVMYRIERSNGEGIITQNKMYINNVLLEEALKLYESLKKISGLWSKLLV